MDKIEITGEKLHELMDSMPKEARIIFERLIMKAAAQDPLKEVKRYLSVFEDDCPIDNLIIRLVAQIINRVGGGIEEDMKKTKKAGSPHYSGHDAAIRAIAEVRKIADSLEEHLSHEKCVNCTTKH
jgi:hypothetical protein